MCVVVAQSKAAGEPQSARSLGKASIALSITGIVIGIVVTIIIVIVYVVGFGVAAASARKVSDSLF